MKETINLEFNNREVGHVTFQVQKQVELILTSSEANMITKIDPVGGGKQINGTHTGSCPTSYHNGGR